MSEVRVLAWSGPAEGRRQHCRLLTSLCSHMVEVAGSFLGPNLL